MRATECTRAAALLASAVEALTRGRTARLKLYRTRWPLWSRNNNVSGQGHGCWNAWWTHTCTPAALIR